MKMFAMFKKHNVSTLHFLAASAMSVPVSINCGAEHALAKEHEEKVANAIKAKADADLANKLEQTPLTGYELYYQEEWGYHYMTNTQLRQEIELRPLDSCELYYQWKWDFDHNMTNARLRQEKCYVPDPSSC